LASSTAGDSATPSAAGALKGSQSNEAQQELQDALHEGSSQWPTEPWVTAGGHPLGANSDPRACQVWINLVDNVVDAVEGMDGAAA
jgi:hypothetical protein